MQLLFDKSYEYGCYNGLGFIKGNVKPISDVIPNDFKIPHIGWNSLNITKKDSRLFKYINDGDFVYFVHSFYGTDCDDVSSVSNYGADLTATVEKDNIFGCQFHPEKSGTVGLNILKAFCEMEA
jgi:glutamine amidotransferase